MFIKLVWCKTYQLFFKFLLKIYKILITILVAEFQGMSEDYYTFEK